VDLVAPERGLVADRTARGHRRPRHGVDASVVADVVGDEANNAGAVLALRQEEE
jgi:hypothetical protein